MRVTIEGLRRWILIVAALLLVVVIGFFFSGRNRFRHIARDLPAHLGANIQQTATGFSYTQSSQGHTLFTLSASKLIQLKAGHALLHNVKITLYGPPGSGREDRISGSDFDYNQNNGVATSQGTVEIELQGLAQSNGAPVDRDKNTIRVRTQGLTFSQKSEDASTAGKVEFQLPRAAGSAVGADYNAKTGVVVLNSQVHITTSSNGKPATVEAGHATILRDSQQALLTNASLEYQAATARADQATVYFRKDVTAEKVDAQGHVHLQSNNGADADAQTAEILFNPKSQPLQAALGGGVQFLSSRPNATMRGSAQEGTLLFAAAAGPGESTSLRHAEFRRDVHFDEQATGLQNDPHGRAEKQVEAGTLNIDFVREAGGHGVEAQKAIADGNPVVTMRQMPSKRPAQSMRISGDQLVAGLADGNRLRSLDGTGNTQVINESSDGSQDTTHGDVLHATFVAQPAADQAKRSVDQPKLSANGGRQVKRAAAPATVTTLDTAVQDGHVTLTEMPAKKPGESAPPATLKGWAQHAEYHAQTQILEMTGHPRIEQGDAMQLSAEQIDYHRDTQNAAASGNVKATYTQASGEASAGHKAAPTMGGSGPVHVIADRAALDHASNQSYFYGTVRAPARMWQDADSLLAPVIEVDRSKNLLKAWGEGTGAAPVVDVNFAAASSGGKRPQQASEVHSRTLVYSDGERVADFQGNVAAAQGDATIHADEARVYLKAKPKADSATKNSGGGTGSQLDHLVATGHVVFTEPGRNGAGEKLVYTAADEKYVLTGTQAVPPRLWDREHGTTTGEALIFSNQTDKVDVVGGKSSVVTETHVPR